MYIYPKFHSTPSEYTVNVDSYGFLYNGFLSSNSITYMIKDSNNPKYRDLMQSPVLFPGTILSMINLLHSEKKDAKTHVKKFLEVFKRFPDAGNADKALTLHSEYTTTLPAPDVSQTITYLSLLTNCFYTEPLLQGGVWRQPLEI